jgi:hypothetical protein
MVSKQQERYAHNWKTPAQTAWCSAIELEADGNLPLWTAVPYPQNVWCQSLIPPTTSSGSVKYSERSFTSRLSNNRTPADKVIDVDDERFHGHSRTGEPFYRTLADFNDPA